MAPDIQHIESVPGRCGGKPCIVGTRIRVYDVYVWHDLGGKSVDEIVNDYPQLTHADVYAALAYYHDHREAIVAQMKSDEELVRQLKANQGPSRLELYLSGESGKDAISIHE
jgi:uncharacterized protein (DUF433 family)